MLSRLVGLGAAVTAGSELAHCFRLLVYYVPSEAAFVAAGACVAPRYRFATAIALGVIGAVMSIIVHVAWQRVVGVTNYVHFALEAVGAVIGVALVFCWERARRRTRPHPTETDPA